MKNLARLLAIAIGRDKKKGKGIGKQDEYFCLTLLKFMGDLGDTFEFLGDSLPFDAGEPDALVWSR